MNASNQQSEGASTEIARRQTYRMPPELDSAVCNSLRDWEVNDKVRRLWERDATLWTGTDESRWLGWLGITEDQLAHIGHLTSLAEEVRSSGFRHALLLGMGGSSLCPEVMALTFGKIHGWPQLHVLDSTDPAQVRATEKNVELAKTLCIVSSKSGSTLEPNIFKQYFFERMKQTVGENKAGEHFIAITDPGSKMQQVAEAAGFRQVFFGLPTIGGRYSALSDFGMVPSAAMGIDTQKFLDQTAEMVHACTATVPVEENPGVLLGTIDLHLCHATHGREALGEECFGVLVERRQRHRRRRQREIEDRRIGGVHLLVGRRLNARRQLAQCLGNRGLHVLRGRIDVARQRELQRDVGTAERAR